MFDIEKYELQIKEVRDRMVGPAGLKGNQENSNKAINKYYNKFIADNLVFRGIEEIKKKTREGINNVYYEAVEGLGEMQVAAQKEIIPPSEQENSEVFYPQPNKQRKLPENDYQKGVYADIEQKQGKVLNLFNYFLPSEQPFIGNERENTFPEPDQLVASHKIDQSVANKSEWDIETGQGREKFYKGWFVNNKQKYNFSPASPALNSINKMVNRVNNKLPGTYKFFIEKLHGRSILGPYQKNNIDNKLSILDLPNRMVFPAYVQQFNESFSSNWDEMNFIGRSESIGFYQNTKRTMQLVFYIMSDFSAEVLAAGNYASQILRAQQQGQQIDEKGKTTTNLSNTQFSELTLAEERLEGILNTKPFWGIGAIPAPQYDSKGNLIGYVPGQLSGTPEQLFQRATFLGQCMYPWYRRDGKMKEQPFIRLRLTDFFDVIARIDSLSMTQDEFDIDLNPSGSIGNVPLAIQVSMDITIVHEEEPTSEYLRFYHRADLDYNSDLIPDTSTETSLTKDSILDNTAMNSPLKFNYYENNDSKFPLEGRNYIESLKTYDNSLKELESSNKSLAGINSSFGLKNKGVNLQDFKMRDKIKRALETSRRIINVAKQIDVFDLESRTLQIPNKANDIIAGGINPTKIRTDLENKGKI